MTPVVLVHGGAGVVADELHAAVREGTAAAAQAGRRALRNGGDAVDAAVAAVRVMEHLPPFNAGNGSCMTSEAQFEVDAAVMRSWDLRSGAIAGVANLADAIHVARAVMEDTPHCLLAGLGAERFARSRGIGQFGREALWTPKAQDRYDRARAGTLGRDSRADTVGAVVVDSEGRLAVGASTGGVLLKMPGRVGDTPLIGAGFYAHPELGAATATGVGEALMTHVVSLRVLQAMRGDEDPSARAQALCEAVRKASGRSVGLIALTPEGAPIVAHACRHMSWAVAAGEAEVRGGLTRGEAPPA